VMGVASVVGMTWGGDDNKLLDLLSARERKAKGMRELKNLDCHMSPVKSQRRWGWGVGAKNDYSFPPEVHLGVVFLGVCAGSVLGVFVHFVGCFLWVVDC
jgi:hypothetical protein